MIRVFTPPRAVTVGVRTTSALVGAAAQGATAAAGAAATVASAGLETTALPVREGAKALQRWRGDDTQSQVDETGADGRRPGNDLLSVASAAMVGVNAAGLGIALVGRALRWPRAPIMASAAMAIANHQPWARRLLEQRIGAEATDTVLSLATTATNVVTLSPATLSIDLVMQVLKTAERRAQARAWIRHGDEFTWHSSRPELAQVPRPTPLPDGPVQSHARRMALVQVIGAGLIGALTRNLRAASAAAVTSSPKAMHTTGEAFTATLGRGLADRHAVLPVRPQSLRRLDSVDTLLIDPRVLCTGRLRVTRVRGADDDELPAAWDRAQQLLEKPGLAPGWHRVGAPPENRSVRGGLIEALILPVPHPMASAVLAEARAVGTETVSVDLDILGDLRSSFDDVRPVDDKGVDDALADALADLQHAGHTVATLSSAGPQALSAGDVALGIMPEPETTAPCNGDLILADLTGAWHVLHAIPAAKLASRRGITLSIGASALGALAMVPGARRIRGPEPVTVGAATGLFSGYLLARKVIRTPVPRPAPVYEWHAMSVKHVREVLAPPGPRTQPAATAHTTSGRHGSRIPNALWQFAKSVRAELSDDPLTPVLALCSAATAVLGSPTDAVMVGAVLTANSMLATAQRLQAENKLNRLLAQHNPGARRITTTAAGAPGYDEVVAGQLQPADLIEVRSNDVVPADARVVEEHGLEVDESSLTGESLPVLKQVAATPGAELADRRCMLYAGTTVVAGTAVALVTAVGADTQARRAVDLAAGDHPDVGLQYQLGRLMNRSFPASASGGALISLLELLRGGGLRQALLSGIAVAVAAVPEGMPLMATLTQQASARRLSRHGALVRLPRSVEALGRADVVCFDKTGTLSQNRLRVAHVHPVSEHSRDDVLRCAARAAPALDGAAPAHATDHAIIEAATPIDDATTAAEPQAHLPFRAGRSFSASVSGAQLTVKGAPEVVLAACHDADGDADGTVARLAADGLRVIAVAQRRLTAQQVHSIQKDPAGIGQWCGAGLSLTGFVGIADTPRPEARRLLEGLADRDVSVRLITGDHPVTATAIAEQLGFSVAPDQVITGTQWNALSRKDQERAVTEALIFSRMSPENKVQIVQTLERTGKVSAMVGDGANDAAALRAATVGIGVVSHGSDAAHAVPDVVLTDGRIEALLDAVDEGRRLWRGVQLAVAGLLGGNAGEVLFSVIGTALTRTSPLNTRQLLLMNMLTDALPATAVAVSTPTGPAQRAGHGLDERALWRAVAVRGAITAAAATTAWAMASVTGRRRRASTVALIALVSAELGQTMVDSHAPLVLLTATGSLAAFAAMISVPGVSQLLGCTPIGPLGWAQGMGSAAIATAAVAATNRFLAAGSETPEPAEPHATTGTAGVSATRHQVDATHRRGRSACGCG
jgi:magnesium-transporting ATPase (P-type)